MVKKSRVGVVETVVVGGGHDGDVGVSQTRQVVSPQLLTTESVQTINVSSRSDIDLSFGEEDGKREAVRSRDISSPDFLGGVFVEGSDKGVQSDKDDIIDADHLLDIVVIVAVVIDEVEILAEKAVDVVIIVIDVHQSVVWVDIHQSVVFIAYKIVIVSVVVILVLVVVSVSIQFEIEGTCEFLIFIEQSLGFILLLNIQGRKYVGYKWLIVLLELLGLDLFKIHLLLDRDWLIHWWLNILE